MRAILLLGLKPSKILPQLKKICEDLHQSRYMMIHFSRNIYLKILLIFKERCICKSSTRKPVVNEKYQQIKYYIVIDLFPWDFYSINDCPQGRYNNFDRLYQNCTITIFKHVVKCNFRRINGNHGYILS